MALEADPLVAFLSGKRESEREPCHVPAVLEGNRGPAAATVLDISGVGVMLQIDDPAFVDAEAKGGLHAYLELMQVHARGGVTLVFPQQGLRLPAAVVRWTAGLAGREPSRVGLKLSRPLTAEEQTALRRGTPLPQPPAAAPTPASPAPTHVPKPGERLAALVFHALKPELGPLAAAEAVAFGPELALLRVEGGVSAEDLSRRLSSGALFLVVLRHGLALWEGTGRLGSVLPGPRAGTLDVALSTPGAWPDALAQRLRLG